MISQKARRFTGMGTGFNPHPRPVNLLYRSTTLYKYRVRSALCVCVVGLCVCLKWKNLDSFIFMNIYGHSFYIWTDTPKSRQEAKCNWCQTRKQVYFSESLYCIINAKRPLCIDKEYHSRVQQLDNQRQRLLATCTWSDQLRAWTTWKWAFSFLAAFSALFLFLKSLLRFLETKLNSEPKLKLLFG